MKKGSSSVVRPSGGTRSSFGGFDSERMEQQAIQSAVSQKSAQQKTGNIPTNKIGQSTQQHQQTQQVAPREMGSIYEELVARPFHDINESIKSFFSLSDLLDINTEDTPEEMAKKREIIARYQKLTEDQQKEAEKKFEIRTKQKQQEEKQKEMRRQQIEEQKKAAIAPPRGKSDKPGLFKSGKGNQSKSQNHLRQQMKTIGTLTDQG